MFMHIHIYIYVRIYMHIPVVGTQTLTPFLLSEVIFAALFFKSCLGVYLKLFWAWTGCWCFDKKEAKRGSIMSVYKNVRLIMFLNSMFKK